MNDVRFANVALLAFGLRTSQKIEFPEKYVRACVPVFRESLPKQVPEGAEVSNSRLHNVKTGCVSGRIPDTHKNEKMGSVIPANVLVISQVEGEDDFNNWHKEMSLKNREADQPMILCPCQEMEKTFFN